MAPGGPVSATAVKAAVTERVPAQRRRPRPAKAALRPAGSMTDTAGAGDPGPLRVAESEQWVSATAGRIALDGYSWLQAVIWVAASGLYEPRRKHGPRFGDTTVDIARLLAELDPCRPGVAYLMRRTGRSRRTVQYHLEMLREAGLLAYVAVGTRVSGERNRASEYVLVIPGAFDRALGVRTVGEGVRRRPCGIGEPGRKAMAELGRKAAGKRCRKRRPAPASRGSRCTPMQGGSSASPPASTTPCPSESKLASGKHTSSPRKKARRGPRKLNTVGRRHQLAGELVRRVAWLRPADTSRLAWVVGPVADAGWTCDEVLACLGLREEPQAGVRRPSGFLADRLRGMPTMPGWTTPKQRTLQVAHRDRTVDAARKNRIQQVRDQRERAENAWQTPRSAAVRREVDELFGQALAPGQPPADVVEELPGQAGPQELTRTELRKMRRAAAAELMSGETTLIGMIVNGQGLAAAERIYGRHLVHRARQLAGMTTLSTFGRGQQ